ncbi:hypothetical protein PIB30_093057, partial [Stylosanthes scabra]|nr:hypothetical protein [Stylosanthes scabra]
MFCEKSFGKTLVWFRISGLSVWCYRENAMMRIAEAIGRPIKIDLATKSADKGSCFGHETSSCSQQVQPKENLVQHLDIEVSAVNTEPNNFKAPSGDKECSKKKVSEAVHQQQAPEITT